MEGSVPKAATNGAARDGQGTNRACAVIDGESRANPGLLDRIGARWRMRGKDDDALRKEMSGIFAQADREAGREATRAPSAAPGLAPSPDSERWRTAQAPQAEPSGPAVVQQPITGRAPTRA